jgi:hypothetical protein
MVLVPALAFALLAVAASALPAAPQPAPHKTHHPRKAQAVTAKPMARAVKRGRATETRSSGSRESHAHSGGAGAAQSQASLRASKRRSAAVPARPAPYRASRTRHREAARNLSHVATIVTTPHAPAPAPGVQAQAAVLTASGAALQAASLSRPMPLPSRMPPPMRGSLTSLERQNAMADAEGLERILDEDDLSDRIAHGLLVPVPASDALAVNPDLPDHHRYCRPWTARFLADLARAHAAQFHGPLEVSSAVRTVAYQKHLMAVNGNAAPAMGDIVSPHLTGATIDIAKGPLSRQEIAWMRAWLIPLQTAGKIDVEEEFQQACFHITVYKSYDPTRPPSSVAGDRKPGLAQPAAGQPRPVQSRVRSTLSDVASGTPVLGR